MKSIVSQKGQVTIPKGVRERLGIRPGTVLDFEAVGGRLIGVKKSGEDAFSRWRGKGRIPGGGDVNGYLKKARG
ncbi:MAG: AbrB/MazE/SpoVT family DNA-binding domain-containing protein [Spirochaetia bacterium]|jgi:AbrB family looped-hinge helix DNA binding protein